MNKTFDTKNNHLEVVRGFAALIVFVVHLIIWPDFNNLVGIEKIIQYVPPSHVMVMVFFMLSGLVIGYSTNQHDRFDIPNYIKKRIVRIYPIYLIAILITIILFKEKTDNIWGSFLFLQNIFVDVLTHNGPLWSLNHEFLYYILAIPIIYFGVNPLLILGFLQLPLFFSLCIYPFDAIFEAYLVGFTFWMVGFWISKQKVENYVSSTKILSALILLFSAEHLNLLSAIVFKLHLLHGKGTLQQNLVSIQDYSFLPICLYTILLATGAFKKFMRWFAIFMYTNIFIYVGYLLVTQKFFEPNYYISSVFVLISLFFYVFDERIKIDLSVLASIGTFSYAFYAIHAPILFAFQYIPFFTGTLLSFGLRALLITILVIFISYLLEIKLQPAIRNYFFNKSKTV